MQATAPTHLSLLELMTVTTVIAILMAVALPSYVDLQLRAKRSELPLIVDGIMGGAIALYQSQDGQLAYGGEMVPDGTPGRQRRVWPSSSGLSGVFVPDGHVFGSYLAERACIYVLPGGWTSSGIPGYAMGTTQALCVQGFTDLDGDGEGAEARALWVLQVYGDLTMGAVPSNATWVDELSPTELTTGVDVY